MKRDYPPMDRDHFGPQHPYMRKGTCHPGMRLFGRRIHPMYHMELFNELETKEDAIDFMDIQKKRIAKRQKYLLKKIQRLESIEDLMEEKIKEIAKMEDYTSDKMKKILNNVRLEYIRQRLEAED
ncbi:MAG: hypothetical protein EAX90_12615 [Candidatus Heimdallarchaeota archaeon]|nr:hypothetical protein [Candidatus Heimdallarchaeota archaeon]